MDDQLPELPPVDLKMQIGYEAIRYVAGFTESYLKDYARRYAEEAVRLERERLEVLHRMKYPAQSSSAILPPCALSAKALDGFARSSAIVPAHEGINAPEPRGTP